MLLSNVHRKSAEELQIGWRRAAMRLHPVWEVISLEDEFHIRHWVHLQTDLRPGVNCEGLLGQRQGGIFQRKVGV